MLYDNYNSTVNKMQKNSNAWHSASDEGKKRLEEENKKLGASIGGTYDSASGKWTNNKGEDLYTYKANPTQKTTEYLDNASSAAQKARRAVALQAANTLGAEKINIEKAARAQSQQNYIQNQQAMRQMPEQLKKLGYSGGLSESAVMGANSAYQNAQMAVMQNKLNKVQEINNAIANEKIRGEADSANIAADFAKMAAQYNENNMDRELAQFNTDREYNYRSGRDEVEDAYRDKVFDRSVYENDRDYNRGVYENDRDYNRSVYENDRDYNRSVYVDDRNYNRSVYADDRDHNYKVKRDDVGDAQWLKQYELEKIKQAANTAYQNKQIGLGYQELAHKKNYDEAALGNDVYKDYINLLANTGRLDDISIDEIEKMLGLGR